MIINIKDPEKGTVKYDINDTLDFTTFKKHCAANKVNLAHVANIVECKEKASGYCYSTQCTKREWRKEKGWAYCLVVNNKIVKIGMSEVTLASRFSSYQAGTLIARNKGTCSVTNFYVSELIRNCLSKNLDIRIYAYSVPTTNTTIKLFGKSKNVMNKNAFAYESILLEEYQSLYNEKLPPLCRNSSKT